MESIKWLCLFAQWIIRQWRMAITVQLIWGCRMDKTKGNWREQLADFHDQIAATPWAMEQRELDALSERLKGNTTREA